MSNISNKPTKIRSLKGPRRLLELEVIDGKRYIKKRDLQKYFFDDMWNIKDFKYHFGLGHRIVRGSLYKWFTVEQIDKSHRDKISKKQRGDSNSNSVNWYRPSKLIPLSELERAIGTCKNKNELKAKLGMTTYELSFLQQFYNYRLPNNVPMIDDVANHHLTKAEIGLLAKVVVGMDWYKDFLSNSVKKNCISIRNLYFLSLELKFICRKLRRYYRKDLRKHSISLNMNLIEYQFSKSLTKLGINHISQQYIKKLKIHVDFLLPDTNTVLELDGQLHSKDKDIKRDVELSKLGYNIIRINLKQEGLNRFSAYKNIKVCLKKYLSNLYDL